ncbi:hypothetical protein Cabther_A1490 [Chloracidobacterium thermophilum B]|uniref:Uncharacterized protein n=1 Tax=Chloracidobacterium thermophilum (strain B) TaxID=981222 RepID=G2LHH7_CHLTF|nr:hypothetical protein Cabther_A1490 [Chloracidobacterium thermophilum B]
MSGSLSKLYIFTVNIFRTSVTELKLTYETEVFLITR